MHTAHDPLTRWTATDRPLRHLPRAGAALLLLVAILGLAWSSHAVATYAAADEARREARTATSQDGFRSDFELYAAINERMAAGESYYAAATRLQRENDFPTRPFVTVRLPTLAVINDTLGTPTVHLALKALLLVSVLAMLGSLGSLGVPAERIGAAAAVLAGGAGVLADQTPLFHDLVAGLLLTLAFVTYRADRWWPSLLLAGAALAVRELALPFVLLWLAFAALQRNWREAGAVAGLLALFATGMALHYFAVDAHRLPDDPASTGWSGLVGPVLPLAALARFTVMLYLPAWLAGPVALVPLVGWIGLGGRMGLFASAWFCGMLLALALFARPENAYWIVMILPAYVAGLAFAPRALADLLRVVTRPGERQILPSSG